MTIPAWFWELLDSSRPSLLALARKLEQLPRDQLIAYAAIYKKAAQTLCNYWEGPVVDGMGFSEDDTEDLCCWIVAQGRRFYTEALRLRGHLEPLVRQYGASERGESSEHPPWFLDVANPGYSGYMSPSALPHAVFETRFGSDLLDELE